MNKFVKIIAIVIAMLLLVAFVACGEKDDENIDTEASETSEVVNTESNTESNTVSKSEPDSESESKSESEAVDTFRVSLGTDNGSGWEDYNEIDN